jgi:hypothetical protein
MTRPALRAAAVLGLAVLTAACAQRPSGSDAGSPGPSEVPRPPAEGLVLEVAHSGGFVTPETTYARLPLVAVYADGRVITQGPTVAVHPGPAMPNLQVAQIDPGRVEELLQHAVDAGVGDQRIDYGMPPVADVPDTRFTAVTAEGPRTSTVYAMQAGLFPEDAELPGLTEEQVAARAQLQDLLDELTGLGAESSRAYEPEEIAAVVSRNYPAGASPDDVATWPGPPLPGLELSTGLEIHCVVAGTDDVEAVLEAAAGATTATVWRNPDGGRWAVSLRPLLPHETGCADLGGS